MKRTVTVAAVVLLAMGAASTVFAGEFDKQIKARKAFMQVYAFNLGLLGAMAKGEAEYNAELASAAANNLLAASKMKNSAMWPQGSDASAPGMADMTRAKPEIWTDYPKVSEKAQALAAALAKMAAEAGNGLDAVKANMGPVGQGCKGCHEVARVPKDK